MGDGLFERRQVMAAKTHVSNSAMATLAVPRDGLNVENMQYFVVPMCIPGRLVTVDSDPPSTVIHRVENPMVIYLLLLKIARTRKKKRRAVDDTARW
jgi:hypothetical protein